MTRSLFPLFQSHLDLAHSYWKKILLPDDTACDATCGNGHDSLILASLPVKTLYLFDIQKEAITNTTLKLKDTHTEIIPHILCHSKMHTVIPKNSVKLIVYNLGYLPGSDKSVKTQPHSTVESLISSLDLVQENGAISITCYPGHKEGQEEEALLLTFCKTLSPKEWSVCHHTWLNRNAAPSLLLLQKGKTAHN